MSVEATSYVWKHSPYRGQTLLVHLAIADVANDAKGFAFYATSQWLADRCRMNAGNVRTHLGSLVRDGFLDVIEPGGGRGVPTTYRFKFPRRGEAEFEPEETASETASKPPRNRVTTTHTTEEHKERSTEEEPPSDHAVSRQPPLVGSTAARHCDECGVRSGRHSMNCSAYVAPSLT